jgi:hypothetical protein
VAELNGEDHPPAPETTVASAPANSRKTSGRRCSECRRRAAPDSRTCSDTCTDAREKRLAQRGNGAKPAPARAELSDDVRTSSGSGLSAAVSVLLEQLGDLAGVQRVTFEAGARVVTITRT